MTLQTNPNRFLEASDAGCNIGYGDHARGWDKAQ